MEEQEKGMRNEQQGSKLLERLVKSSKELTAMTTSYYADRINLFHLMHLHPDWTQEQLAQAVGRSKSWVYKWQTRLESVAPGDDGSLHEIAQGQSQVRKHPPERIDPRIEALILSIRDEPRGPAPTHARSQSDSLLPTQTDHAVGKRSAIAHLDTHHLSDP
jgi:hypothetical protein